MSDPHDPTAILHHAAQADDWRLVELIARILSGRSTAPATTADRAYATLVVQLGLADDNCDYDQG
jgi:hypothetical protein